MKYFYLLFLLLLSVSVRAQAPEVVYAEPIIIRQGGTYTANYRSLNSAVPCVQVYTSEPVVLLGCTLAGAGDLIVAGGGADLTVRNCRGYGLLPTQDNRPRGRFVDAYQARQLVVEHNYLEHTAGILANRWSGNGSAQQTLTVRYNQGRNCDGRFRNGGTEHRSFVQLNTVQQLAGIDISFNEFRNDPNESAVEDNINFYNSSGTAQSPAKVHDNYVQGAYPFPATGSYFTGTGITSDGDGTTLATAAGFLEAYNNQFVSICNAAMNIAAGHDISYHDNRMVTSGVLPDGTRLSATYAATAIFNYYNQATTVFFNNHVEENLIGYVKWGATFPYYDRQDQDVQSGQNLMPITGNDHLPDNPITPQTEQDEWAYWQQKLQQQQAYVGPEPATPLPVTLVSFASRPAAGRLLLTWQTAQEVNSSYFELQQSAAGDVFTGIGTVQAAGTSNSPRQYSFSLAAPTSAQYLRLKMTDQDGSSRYSQVIRVVPEPGPSTMAAPVRQTLYTVRGQQLWQRPYRAQTDWGELRPGLYVLRTQHQDGTATSEKLLVE